MYVNFSRLKHQASDSNLSGLPTFSLCLRTTRSSLALGENYVVIV